MTIMMQVDMHMIFQVLVLYTVTTEVHSLFKKQAFVLADFNFDENSACQYSAHLLVNSIPLSCNDALMRLLSSGAGELPVDIINPDLVDLGDLCQSYCITPMRQAGEDCAPLAQLHTTLRAACNTNHNGSRCFDVRGGPVISLWENYTNISVATVNTSNSSSPCLELIHARDQMGCCFNSLLNNSGYDYQPLDSSELWAACGHSLPEEPCAAAQVNNHVILVLTLALMILN